MPELQVGQPVRVISCCDTDDYDGQEGVLARIDRSDSNFTYRVEFENGDDVWAQVIQPIEDSGTLHSVISEFMQGTVRLGRVKNKLGLGQCVIVKMNLNNAEGDTGYGGPYILVWRSLDDQIFKWCSSDSYMNETNYRLSGNQDIRIKREYVRKSAGYEAFTIELGQSNLGAHMKERLGLDSDYFKGGTSDSTVHHSAIAEAITKATPLVAQPVNVVTTQSQTGETVMSNKIQAIVARGKSSVATAAQIQAGKALNITVMKGLKAKAPMMVRGYLDHPVAPALVAVLLVAGSEFVPAGPAREKVAKAADLMLIAALTDGADKFLDVEGMIDKAFAGLPDEAKALLQ